MIPPFRPHFRGLWDPHNKLFAETMAEQWKEITTHPGYQVSDQGNVRGKKGAILAQSKTYAGYMRVSLQRADKRRCVESVHRLVAKAFLPNPDALPEVDHKAPGDGGVPNRSDNRASMLEWVSKKENAKRKVRDPSKPKNPGSSRKIVQLLPDGYAWIWESVREASKALTIGDDGIIECCKGRVLQANGSEWFYIEDFEDPPSDEEWREVDIDGRIIEASSLGRIRTPSGHITPGTVNGGYYSFGKYRVHRLVALAFCEKPNNAAGVVNHKDGNPLNNLAQNLEWVTQRENTIHAVGLGKVRVRAVRRTKPSGEVIDYPSVAEASAASGATRGSIVCVCQGKRSTAAGSAWAYL